MSELQTQWQISFCQQRGNQKARNQDALFNGRAAYQYKLKQAEQFTTDQPHLLLGVADGVSNSPSAHKASRFWMEALASCERLNRAWIEQTQHDFNQALSETALGSSTTFAAVEIDIEQAWVKILSIGDSRIYLINPQGEWQLLTEDHSILSLLGKQSDENSKQHYASMYSGLSSYLVADGLPFDEAICQTEVRLKLGDILLLCTDGLTDGIPSDERQRIWQQYDNHLDRLTALRKRVKQLPNADDLSVVVCGYDAK